MDGDKEVKMMRFLVVFVVTCVFVPETQAECGRGEADAEVTVESFLNGTVQDDGGIIKLYDTREDECEFMRDLITIRLTMNDHITTMKSVILLHHDSGVQDKTLIELNDRNRPVIVHFMPEEFLEFDLAFVDGQFLGETARYCLLDAADEMEPGIVYDFLWVAD